MGKASDAKMTNDKAITGKAKIENEYRVLKFNMPKGRVRKSGFKVARGEIRPRRGKAYGQATSQCNMIGRKSARVVVFRLLHQVGYFRPCIPV